MREPELIAEMRNCISNCVECHASCLETSAHCLTLARENAAACHQTLLQDCAEICQTSANFMLRGSAHHEETCGVCATLCLACAESCDDRSGVDETMHRCAEICRKCAQSCERMAAMAN